MSRETKRVNVKLLSSVDRYGGAGLAAYRLLHGLNKAGLPVDMLVQDKIANDNFVHGPRTMPGRLLAKALPYLDPVVKLKYVNRHRGAWSCGLLPNPFFPMRDALSADLLHLHWVCGGFLPISLLNRLPNPIIWTLHDSWPFTGGCHVPQDCHKYEMSCGACPQLGSRVEQDLSRKIWQEKYSKWKNLDMTIVAPSRWMASCASASSLLCNKRVEVIPNGLDMTVFSPMQKREARHLLGLPAEGRFLLFSAMGGFFSKDKGGDLLQECLRRLSEEPGDDFILLLTGSDKSPDKRNCPVPFFNLGRLTEESKMRQVYSAADITLVPSRSESLGYVAIESMACGTPCVAFDHSGTKDIVDHMLNGYLACPFEPDALAEGVLWALENQSQYKRLAAAAREKVEKVFSLEQVAKSHLALYSEILDSAS